MMIGLGRRRLIIEVSDDTGQDKAAHFPSSVEASDSELARLNALRNSVSDRDRWQAESIYWGVTPTR